MTTPDIQGQAESDPCPHVNIYSVFAQVGILKYMVIFFNFLWFGWLRVNFLYIYIESTLAFMIQACGLVCHVFVNNTQGEVRTDEYAKHATHNLTKSSVVILVNLARYGCQLFIVRGSTYRFWAKTSGCTNSNPLLWTWCGRWIIPLCKCKISLIKISVALSVKSCWYHCTLT